MRQYAKYAKPYLGAFIIGPCLMLTEVFGEVMLPKMMSLIINNGVANRDSAYIVRVGLAMVAVVLVMAVSGIGGSYFAAKASISFTSDLRRDMFARVQQFSFKNIDDFSTGSLVTRLTNDVQQLQQVMLMGLKLALRAPGMLLGALVMAFLMNPSLALIILIVIPILAAAIAVILKTAYPRFEIMQKVGMTKKEIRKSINSQMLTVFFAPLLMAGLHLGFAFPFVYRLLMLFGLYDRLFLLEVTGACYLVFALFYVVVYGITSRAYYRIVSAGENR